MSGEGPAPHIEKLQRAVAEILFCSTLNINYAVC